MKRAAMMLVLAGVSALPPIAQAQEPKRAQQKYGKAQPLSREGVVDALHKAIEHLASIQNEDGSWGAGGPESELEANFAINTYASWRIGAHAIACGSLLGSARGDLRHEATLQKAVDWLVKVELPERDSDWDIDYVWSAVYGFNACVELLQDERFQGPGWKPRLELRGKEFLKVLVENQALSGGWAYYDMKPYAKTPTWATSFTTAAVLPALHEAKHKLGWAIEDKVLARAQKYVESCALPNGAYAYDRSRPYTSVSGVESINQVPGSLSRIQVCNWALVRLGVKRVTSEILREGLRSFFRYHGFLDHVRTRPIPHEGFFANAGYFYFFGHHYAGKVIELLPLEERAQWHSQLSAHLAKTQWANGGTSDFLRSPYMVVSSTSFLIAGLQSDLDSGTLKAKKAAEEKDSQEAQEAQATKKSVSDQK